MCMHAGAKPLLSLSLFLPSPHYYPWETPATPSRPTLLLSLEAYVGDEIQLLLSVGWRRTWWLLPFKLR